MQYLAVLALALSMVAAQGPKACQDMASKFEACPKQCIDTAAKGNSCSVTPLDLTCLCKDMSKIQIAALPCVQKCQGANIGKLISDAKAVCDCNAKGGA